MPKFRAGFRRRVPGLQQLGKTKNIVIKLPKTTKGTKLNWAPPAPPCKCGTASTRYCKSIITYGNDVTMGIHLLWIRHLSYSCMGGRWLVVVLVHMIDHLSTRRSCYSQKSQPSGPSHYLVSLLRRCHKSERIQEPNDELVDLKNYEGNRPVTRFWSV